MQLNIIILMLIYAINYRDELLILDKSDKNVFHNVIIFKKHDPFSIS